MELEDGPPAGPPREGGLTMAEMQAVAREVGVDPAMVARAAALLPRHSTTPWEKVAGGPARLQAAFDTPGTPDTAGLGRAVQAVREVLGNQGAVVRELGATTWHSVGEVNQVHVTLRPEDGGTRVQVTIDRRGAASLIWPLTVIVFLILAGASGDALAPGGVLGGFAYLLAFLLAGLGTARTIWSVTSSNLEARMQRLTEALSRELDAPGTLPRAVDPTDG